MITRRSFQERWLSRDLIKAWLDTFEGDMSNVSYLKRHCKLRQCASLEERQQTITSDKGHIPKPETSQNKQQGFQIWIMTSTNRVLNVIAYSTMLFPVHDYHSQLSLQNF